MSEGTAGGSSDAGSSLAQGVPSDTRWWAQPGAWLLAVPGLAWWALNVAVIAAGALSGSGLGRAGWLDGRPELTRRIAVLLELVQLDAVALGVREHFDPLLAVPAVPSLLLGLLCAGAVLTVHGRRGWRRVAVALAVSSALGVLLTLALAASVWLLEAVA